MFIFQAFPFVLDVYTEDCDATLKVTNIESMSEKLDKALVSSVIEKVGELINIPLLQNKMEQ